MDIAQYIPYLPTLLLAVARLGGMLASAPVFGERAVPMRLRLFAAVVMGLAVAGQLGPVAHPGSDIELLIAIVTQAALGLAIGYAARLVFAGVELGAFHVGQQMGLSLAETFDPTTDEAFDVVRRLLRIFAIVIFLAVGGHRLLVQTVMMTFQTVPLTGFAGPSAVVTMLVSLLASAFVLALKLAAPVLLALLLAAAAMGFLQRTMPQCNILSIGLPLRALLGVLMLAAALAAAAGLTEAYLIQAIETLRQTLARI